MSQRARLLEEMNQTRNGMDATMRRYQDGLSNNRMQALDTFTKLSDHFDAFSRKHDALWSDAP